MGNLCQCLICHMGYVDPEDRRIHAVRHTEYLRNARLASRYSASNADRKEFVHHMNYAQAYIVDIIGLGELCFPEEEFHLDSLLTLKRNVCYCKKRVPCLDDMVLDGYMTVVKNNGFFYSLTYKGFECLATWMDRDLICLPKG